ncbi:tyrosinase precursor, Monophenol monooxygenase [Piedraia hortae CBS 480.64]|uniref:tyrosinase n=1 Tax=Piedraia hortae CBS 480.64 TaxID=1314780 RepID=A0A6A7CAG9_9PEZI|nr:tyrosinase precursor, Monophenol monooxygenase [Piedraia hortae CBS 480.64]
MKFLSLATGLALFGQHVLAHTVPADLDAGEGIERRQSQIVVTTGASGSVQPRLEIRQMLYDQPDQWNLMLLALQAYYKQKSTDPTSYYQIAGIHGVPQQNYNNVGKCSTCSNTDGYCTHDSILFPSWHRVYIAHFEQQFVALAKQIASQYTGSMKTRMQQAANTIRWPYWDWAAIPPNKKPVFPEIFTQSTISVNSPTGQITITNPLYRADIADISKLVYTPFTSWPSTLRYPNSNSRSASSQPNKAVSAFSNVRSSLQDQVYQLFTSCDDYAHFSNDMADSSSTSCSNSLEGIHNTIHTLVGGAGSSSVSGGHMTYLSMAAFDPVFWLHHCNVDRIFALWQSQHDSYGGSQTAPHNTWTIAQGTNQNSNSKLTPFYKDTRGNFWTTNDVEDWTVFKYTYPEFVSGDGSSSTVARYINQLYGPGASAVAGSIKPRDISSNLFSSVPPTQAQNGSLFQYVANVHAPRYALNGSYTIHVFDGSPKIDDPDCWLEDDHLIGIMGVLASPSMQGADVVAAGSIPLTRKLTNVLNSGKLGDLSQGSVGPFLEKQFLWRIRGPDGKAVAPESLDGFKVAVYSSTYTQPKGDKLPTWSQFFPVYRATENRPGGAAPNNPLFPPGSPQTLGSPFHGPPNHFPHGPPMGGPPDIAQGAADLFGALAKGRPRLPHGPPGMPPFLNHPSS